MIFDAHCFFSDNQVVTGATSVTSTNVTDMVGLHSLGSGEPIKCFISVTAKGAGTAPSFQAQLIAADDAALGTNPVTLGDTGTVATASITVPQVFHLGIPVHTKKQFVGIKYTINNADNSFTVKAGLVKDEQSTPMV